MNRKKIIWENKRYCLYSVRGTLKSYAVKRYYLEENSNKEPHPVMHKGNSFISEEIKRAKKILKIKGCGNPDSLNYNPAIPELEAVLLDICANAFDRGKKYQSQTNMEARFEVGEYNGLKEREKLRGRENDKK